MALLEPRHDRVWWDGRGSAASPAHVSHDWQQLSDDDCRRIWQAMRAVLAASSDARDRRRGSGAYAVAPIA